MNTYSQKRIANEHYQIGNIGAQASFGQKPFSESRNQTSPMKPIGRAGEGCDYEPRSAPKAAE